MARRAGSGGATRAGSSGPRRRRMAALAGAVALLALAAVTVRGQAPTGSRSWARTTCGSWAGGGNH